MTIPQRIIDRWTTGQLTGANKHALVVRVRPGRIERDYVALTRIDGGRVPHVSPTILKGNNHEPWQGTWTPLGSWVTLPNIQNAKYTRAFDQNGSGSMTVLMDNIFFEEQTGFAGVFHAIRRGYFSPARGITLASRPDLWDDTGWSNRLNGGYQIEIWEGYGQGDEVTPLDEPDSVTHSCAPPDAAITRTFTGIIEDCDLESHPDHITITARDFGVLFTDQRVAGTNKAAEIIAPTTFSDRRRTLGEVLIFGFVPPGPFTNTGADVPNSVLVTTQASSVFDTHGGITGWVPEVGSGFWYSESAFTPGDGWWSAPSAHTTDTQWLEVNLPAGDYLQFALMPTFEGMEMWISFYMNGTGGQVDGASVPAGWLDLGVGTTPDGTKYIDHYPTIPTSETWGYYSSTFNDPLTLSHEITVPEGSRVRFTFSKLSYQDPTYDTAPPFPYSWFQALVAAATPEAIGPFQDAVDAARRDVSAAWAQMDWAQHQLNVTKGAIRYVFGPPLPHDWRTYMVGTVDVARGWEAHRFGPSVPGYYLRLAGDFESQYNAAVTARQTAQTALDGAVADLKAAIQHNTDSITYAKDVQAVLTFYTALWVADSVANPGYYAGVKSVLMYRLGDDTPGDNTLSAGSGFPAMNVDALEWVLVDDASDVIVMLSIWLGFKEWDIDPFGWSLVNPMQWGSDKFFIDIVNDILAQGNFVFFMGPPTDDDRSIGVPCFKMQNATTAPRGQMVTLTDQDLLETAQMKWDLSNLPGAFRYRGDPVQAADNLNTLAGGQTYEEDLVATYMATYIPPWAGSDYQPLSADATVIAPDRLAGIMRHFTQTVGVNVPIGLSSNEECLFACLLAAMQYALAMCTGRLQVAGRPGLRLNDQISIIEEATAINSRVWLASIESDHSLGPQGKWTMVFSGSYIDTEDMGLLVSDYHIALVQLSKIRTTNPNVVGMVPVGEVPA